MIKQFALLKTKPGLTHEAFVEHYETNHVPLIETLIPFHRHYRRNHIRPNGSTGLTHAGGTRPWFDVLTMLKYDDQKKLAQLTEQVGRDGVGETIAADEKRFLDRSAMLMLAVDEHETDPGRLRPRPEGHAGPPEVKLIALLEKKPGMSRDDFIDYYERRHSDLALRILIKDDKPLFAGYARNYPVPDGRFPMSHVASEPPEFDYDVISEFWFWTRADFDYFASLRSERGIAAALELDEKQLFDRTSAILLDVDERITR